MDPEFDCCDELLQSVLRRVTKFEDLAERLRSDTNDLRALEKECEKKAHYWLRERKQFYTSEEHNSGSVCEKRFPLSVAERCLKMSAYSAFVLVAVEGKHWDYLQAHFSKLKRSVNRHLLAQVFNRAVQAEAYTVATDALTSLRWNDVALDVSLYDSQTLRHLANISMDRGSYFWFVHFCIEQHKWLVAETALKNDLVENQCEISEHFLTASAHCSTWRYVEPHLPELQHWGSRDLVASLFCAAVKQNRMDVAETLLKRVDARWVDSSSQLYSNPANTVLHRLAAWTEVQPALALHFLLHFLRGGAAGIQKTAEKNSPLSTARVAMLHGRFHIAALLIKSGAVSHAKLHHIRTRRHILRRKRWAPQAPRATAMQDLVNSAAATPGTLVRMARLAVCQQIHASRPREEDRDFVDLYRTRVSLLPLPDVLQDFMCFPEFSDTADLVELLTFR